VDIGLLQISDPEFATNGFNDCTPMQLMGLMIAPQNMTTWAQ
jgi:hypothetical protein